MRATFSSATLLGLNFQRRLRYGEKQSRAAQGVVRTLGEYATRVLHAIDRLSLFVMPVCSPPTRSSIDILS